MDPPLLLLPIALSSLIAAGGGGAKVAVEQGPPALQSPWQVPGVCSYDCGDAGACASPCAPDETPASQPFVCCSASNICVTRKTTPPGVTATCPMCPGGWTVSPVEPSWCCDSGSHGCYSQATGFTDVTATVIGPTCSGGADCACMLHSVDGRTYGLQCTPGGCVCTADGQTVKSLPSLCPPPPVAIDTGYLLWGCGFPPF